MKLIGLAELAELYGVSKNTANTWARRHDWPAPVQNLKMGPVWDQDVVLAHKPIEINHEQRHPIHCAWCGGDELIDILNDTSPPDRSFDYGLMIWCAPCGKRSQVHYVKDSEADDCGFGPTKMSLKVTKKEDA